MRANAWIGGGIIIAVFVIGVVGYAFVTAAVAVADKFRLR